jgi:peptide/nickel transport system substrate-binding protein
MFRFRRTRAVGLLCVAVAVIAAACSSSGSKSSSGSSGVSGTATTSSSSGAVKQGGSLIISAEQEPDCMDWLGACASSAWGVWTGDVMTMPAAYVYDDAQGWIPSPVLTGPADVVTSPNLVVTYHINPQAVWSDGQPITSTDFKYTWNQIVTGKNIFVTTGWTNIESVDDSDPHTAVVTYKTPYADWKSLFADPEPILPSHILATVDRDTAMKDGYTWSGGPWKLDHWTKGVEAEYVPNPMYWGKKPNLSSVTFRFITDTAAEQQDFKSGQVVAVYPQAQPGENSLKGPGVDFSAVSGLSFEAVWFNLAQAPLNDPAVRQALAYATDRNAIVQQLFAPIEPGIQPIQSLLTPAFGSMYSTAFSEYSLDLSKVTSIMTAAGYAKDSSGIWAKGGKEVSLTVKTTTGNQRRLLTGQILQSEWKNAGFNMTLDPEAAGVLFGQDLPNGSFQAGLYAQNPSDNDPSISGCTLWCTNQIPGPANGGNGENYDRYSNPMVDSLAATVDSSLDMPTRIADVQKIQAQLAVDVPAIPLDPFPDIVVVNGNNVGYQGASTFPHNFVTGPFTYLNYWYAK